MSEHEQIFTNPDKTHCFIYFFKEHAFLPWLIRIMLIIIRAEQPEMGRRGKTCLATSQMLVQKAHGNDIKPCHHLPFHSWGTNVTWCSDLHKWLWATLPLSVKPACLCEKPIHFVQWKSQLNNSRWVYKHTQETRRQAEYKQICSDCTVSYIKHLHFTWKEARSSLLLLSNSIFIRVYQKIWDWTAGIYVRNKLVIFFQCYATSIDFHI